MNIYHTYSRSKHHFAQLSSMLCYYENVICVHKIKQLFDSDHADKGQNKFDETLPKCL